MCIRDSQMLVQRSAANHATALIALDLDVLAYWGRAEGLTATDNATRAVGSEVRRHVETCVDELSGRLTAAPASPRRRCLVPSMVPAPNAKPRVAVVSTDRSPYRRAGPPVNVAKMAWAPTMSM